MRGANDTWVLRPPLRCLVPPVGVWAFSPDDTMFAWSEGPHQTRVNVTEVETMRTVLELDGEIVMGLQWSSAETLRVFRRAGGDAVVRMHAIPDGGEVARMVLRNMGMWALDIDASVDGRVALVRRLEWGRRAVPGRRERAWVLRDDTATGWAAELGEATALSPDGTHVVSSADILRVTALAGTEVATLGDAKGVTHVAWVDNARLFIARNGATNVDVSMVPLARDAAAPAVERTQLRGTIVPGVLPAVHPDRTRVLLLVDHAVPRPTQPRQRSAEVVGLREHRLFGGVGVDLASPSPPRDLGCGGGAWWRDDGALQTLTREGEDGAVVRTLATPTQVDVFARLSLPGRRPHLLLGAVSPRRTHAVVTWRTLDGGSFDRPLRLGLLPTRQNA